MTTKTTTPVKQQTPLLSNWLLSAIGMRQVETEHSIAQPLSVQGDFRTPLVLQPPLLQPKLTIGQPNDRYEQEADRVANRVMRMPAPIFKHHTDVEKEEDEERLQAKPLNEQISPLVQRQSEAKKLQAKGAGNQGPQLIAGLESRLGSLKGAGQPLSESSRAFFEPRFGHDFSNIRIHTGNYADQATRLVNARAFTYGNQIVFAYGNFQPHTESGRWLLAHELTHTIQQDIGQRKGIQQTGRGSRPWSRTASHEIEDTIHAIELSLSIARQRLTDTSIPRDRLARIRQLSSRLRTVLPQLRAAPGTDGSSLVIPFDTDPAANEIIPGDANRSIEELYYPFSISEPLPPAAGLTAAATTEPPLVQAKAIQGVTVSALSTPVIQRFCDPIVCLGLIVLGGLLLSGCSTRSSGTMGARRLAQAQANFDSNNSDLDATKRAKIHTALSSSVGDNPHLLISYYDYYSNKEIIEANASRLRDWGEDTYAQTERNDDTYVRPTILAASFPNLTLGSLLIHEYTHTRHEVNWMGASDYEEGDSYGIEFFFAERNNDARRLREIRDIMDNPSGVVLASQVSAFWELFCKSYGGMKVLYEVIDSGRTSHTSSRELNTLTADQARELSAELVATRRSNRSTRLAQIIDWVWANKSSIGMSFRRCNL